MPQTNAPDAGRAQNNISGRHPLIYTHIFSGSPDLSKIVGSLDVACYTWQVRVRCTGAMLRAKAAEALPPARAFRIPTLADGVLFSIRHVQQQT